MFVEIRLYKRFDIDLLALLYAGYSVGVMMKEAVTGYAHSYPIAFFLDEAVSFNPGSASSVHIRFAVPDEDKKTCYLLRHIKPKYRNSFCKTVLRNAMVQQNLAIYFTDTSLYHLQNNNMKDKNLYMHQNLIPCSKMKIEEIRKTAADTARVKKQKTKAERNTINPYSQMPGMQGMGNPYAGHPVPDAWNQPPSQPPQPQTQPGYDEHNPFAGEIPVQGMGYGYPSPYGVASSYTGYMEQQQTIPQQTTPQQQIQSVVQQQTMPYQSPSLPPQNQESQMNPQREWQEPQPIPQSYLQQGQAPVQTQMPVLPAQSVSQPANQSQNAGNIPEPEPTADTYTEQNLVNDDANAGIQFAGDEALLKIFDGF